MMMKNDNHTPRYVNVPLLIAFALVLGIFIGSKFASKSTIDLDRKINNILGIVADEYVESVNMDSLVELAIPDIIAQLDPHSVYISAKDYEQANEELNGNFCGIGISFQVMEDTINVIEVIPGGPSEKVGIANGDKIISVDGKNFTGEKINPNLVKEQLRGPKNSVVKLGVKRATSAKTLYFTVTRGDIPIKSVDAAYMIDKNTGYVKVNQFGRNTYDEFVAALSVLKNEGAKRYIVDLRGNGGGYMEIAVAMANEFLPKDNLIVSTKGRYKKNDTSVYSDGNGSYQDAEIVVLINEFSASASEIFAGAMQDNDRGLVIGARSFGKGLVQREFKLSDNSAIRLTIARYYTPTGRCIQKDYKLGQAAYERELINRFNNGELDYRDSIKVDKSKMYKTPHGRIVYGGGGIIPDIFVPRDTVGFTSYYYAVVNAGLIQNYVLKYVTAHKAKFKNVKDYKDVIRLLDDNTQLLNDFVNFAAKHDVPARWYYINQSRDLLLNDLKAFVARDLLGQKAFYPIYNRNDKTIEAALKALNKHKAAFPLTAD
ncbi:MAG: S41 family peptidase [bacterium]|nr:S41 family peptidase [bacterium]MDD6833450.1 S41 family peptidase [bacterium]